MTSRLELEVFSRQGGLARLFVSLNAGAILLTATFLREPPTPAWTRWLVFLSLTCFLVAFIAFLVALIFVTRVHDIVTSWVVSLETKEEMSAEKFQKQRAATQKRKNWYRNLVAVGLYVFVTGIVLMFIMAAGVLLSGPKTPGT